MELSAAVQVAAFTALSFIAVAGALGMATTMSMFRSAIFLMASFIGVAGLFILLLADLLGMLQVMMYVGGMLVMALFMVLFSHDPGGEMMSTHMSLPWLERLFSGGLRRPQNEQRHAQPDGGGHGDMSMFTTIKKPAAVLAIAIGAGLIGLVLLRPDAWAVADRPPAQDSAARIGALLMGKYMVAFEGAALLILLGIFGAVWLARPSRYPDPTDRGRIRAAVDAAPAPSATARDDRAGETR